MFIPERHEEVTAEWLTEALRSGGVIGDESVREFQIEPLGADRSRTSSLARITVEYDGGAEGLPGSMFVKFVSRIPGNREFAANYNLFQQEIELYKNLGDSIPLNMPKMYFGRVSENRDVAALLLEELTGVSKESLPPAQRTLTTSETKLAMSELSKMHARFWEDRALNEYEWLPGLDNDFRRWIYQSYDEAWAKLQDILEPAFTSAEIKICSGLSSNLPTLMTELGSMPITLCHGDFHPGNLLWDGLGEPKTVWTLDWQLPSRAPAVTDVARIMGNGVAGADLHLIRQDYLPEYHSALVSGGVTDYDYERFLNDYRHGLLDVVALMLALFADLDFAREDFAEFIRLRVGVLTAVAVDAGCADLIS